MPMTEVDDENNTEACHLCNSKEKDIVKFGKVYRLEEYIVHHFCLLFASGLPQNGEDSEGIFGFLKEDLDQEILRGSSSQCSYCEKKGATASCVEKNCNRSFHYHCSLEKKGLFQFFDTFPAWCHDHRPIQTPFTTKYLEETTKRFCGICLEVIPEQTSQLWAPCCRGFFDSLCVSKLAATSGFSFKCPLCNNNDVFNTEMKKFGVHVPEQHADWEKEQGELLGRHVQCDAEVCSCEDGRNYDEDDTIYEIILCHSCGSCGIHIQCGKLKLSDPVFLCNVCKGPEETSENESGRRKSLRGRQSGTEPTNVNRKEKSEKVMKSPSPSKNLRKKCSLRNHEEPVKSRTVPDGSTLEKMETTDKRKRGRPKLCPTSDKNCVSEEVLIEANCRTRQTRGNNDQTQTANTKKSDDGKCTPKEKVNSRGKRGKDFVCLVDTRRAENHITSELNEIEKETDESSQPDEKINNCNINNPIVVKIDPSILDATEKNDAVKTEVREEELDTELFDLANQIDFNFEIPSSPLRSTNEASPSKQNTPKKSPAKCLPKNNLAEKLSSSPLKENRRGRLRTSESTPIKEIKLKSASQNNQQITSPSGSTNTRRSTRKNDPVHETREIVKCALNLENKLENQAHLKQPLNQHPRKTTQNKPSKVEELQKTKIPPIPENISKDCNGHKGDISRTQRSLRRRDCTSPAEILDKDSSETSSLLKKPFVINLGVKSSPGTTVELAKSNQKATNIQPVPKLSAVELRKNRLEHAKIRVKINELMDELDTALAKQDYAAAEVVKQSLERLKISQKKLEDDALVSTATPCWDSNLNVEITKAKIAQESQPIPTHSRAKRKRTEAANDSGAAAERSAHQERLTKRLRIENDLHSCELIQDKEERTLSNIREKRHSETKPQNKDSLKTPSHDIKENENPKHNKDGKEKKLPTFKPTVQNARKTRGNTSLHATSPPMVEEDHLKQTSHLENIARNSLPFSKETKQKQRDITKVSSQAGPEKKLEDENENSKSHSDKSVEENPSKLNQTIQSPRKTRSNVPLQVTPQKVTKVEILKPSGHLEGIEEKNEPTIKETRKTPRKTRNDILPQMTHLDKKEIPEEKIPPSPKVTRQSPRKSINTESLEAPRKLHKDDSNFHSNRTNDRLSTSTMNNEEIDTSRKINKITNDSNTQNIPSGAPVLTSENPRSVRSSSRLKVDPNQQPMTRNEDQNFSEVSRISPQKAISINKDTKNVIKEKSKTMQTEKIKSIPDLNNFQLKSFCINLFNINSTRQLCTINETKSKQIILHLNKYLIKKSGKTHSKQKSLKRKIDDSIEKLSEDLVRLETEVSEIITQDKLRENKKIILHFNLKTKSVTMKSVTQNSEKDEPRCEKMKDNQTRDGQKKVLQNQQEKDNQPELRRSGRSRMEPEKANTTVKNSKPKKSITKSNTLLKKPTLKGKTSSRKRKETNPETVLYPYAAETLEEELFYQICPLKPTSQPKGVLNQSSGRIGEKKNNKRRILISMQKLGRSPILDRPLSFVAFTFDGSNLISHETVDELKERTHSTKKPSIKKPLNKRTESIRPKLKSKSVKISRVHNSIRKNKISIWKSSKFNSRIKTMISKNGTIQMTVNKDVTSEVPNGLNVSKYFKIRRTSSFSPASQMSTSPINRPENISEIHQEKNVATKRPSLPVPIPANPDQTPPSPQEESPVSPMKLKIPKDLWVKAKKDKRLLKLEKKQASAKQRSNSSPKTVKVKYKNLYGRVIEYAKNLPRKI